MRIEQRAWTEQLGWSRIGRADAPDADLVLVFGGASPFRNRALLDELRTQYPHADLLGCSAAGEIVGTQVHDDSIVATAIALERTSVRGARVPLRSAGGSQEAGRALGKRLRGDGLAHVFVLSEGLVVNGSELVRGITETIPEGVTVTGGLSGDGARFEETLVLWSDEPRTGQVAAVGFYGSALRVGYGSLGGWDPFGPQRLITRSEGSVLYELDGKPALELYKRYLGHHAHELPASGLLFPLAITATSDRDPVVRTILAIDEQEGSMTFAGDVPEGSVARLMKANFDRLIDGASGAAHTCVESLRDPELAILISCVGRKLVLKQRVEEEVEAVRDVVGPDAVMAGFYSYGEISPFMRGACCELHNQTMTITTLSEGP
ncbi:MAG: FIST C-terminal domain-containing protein [Gemmatimonadota bacterium]|nr:FIST C-terminal domain-containing protein [Gemmatimonadota bacterium]